MRIKIKAVILTVALMLGVSIASATPSSAHSTCRGEYANQAGPCNVVQNIGYVGVGIFDWSTSSSWSWILPGTGFTQTNGSPLYQADVGGFWIGQGWCTQVLQSNNNGVTWGYYGVIRGPVRFKTDYWIVNRIDPFQC